MTCRKQNPYQTLIQIGIDSGGGSLKVICNLFDPEKERCEDQSSHGTYSGINHSIVLAYCDNLQETHKNLVILLDLLKLEDCKYVLAADLKIINILLGISVSYDLKIFCDESGFSTSELLHHLKNAHKEMDLDMKRPHEDTGLEIENMYTKKSQPLRFIESAKLSLREKI
nr:uncharacterized protein LOC124816038 [Hydra vulgaris]